MCVQNCDRLKIRLLPKVKNITQDLGFDEMAMTQVTMLTITITMHALNNNRLIAPGMQNCLEEARLAKRDFFYIQTLDVVTVFLSFKLRYRIMILAFVASLSVNIFNVLVKVCSKWTDQLFPVATHCPPAVIRISIR